MKKILLILLLLVGLTSPPDPVTDFTLNEPVVFGNGFTTIVDFLCKYECQRREWDPDYCKKACGD